MPFRAGRGCDEDHSTPVRLGSTTAAETTMSAVMKEVQNSMALNTMAIDRMGLPESAELLPLVQAGPETQ